ncbi:hypothetical protein EDC04DRAFT_2193016 [Pisolithus marmoratus]|nr:hypothetical protein EDC04DRAFT_2193016 [Pisolithus marmoratus]
MSTGTAAPNSPHSYFRRRLIGRASSPPTWACYEQIPYDDDDDDDDDYTDSQSEDNSCSEDGEDYRRPSSNDPDGDRIERQDDTQNMEIDRNTCDGDDKCTDEKGGSPPPLKKDIKGKQRAVDPEPEPMKRRHRRKERRPTHTLRPILTIQKSQGFVWNQDLFVPPYIKDRYVASTSPPGSRGFISNSWSKTSSMADYEVEVVEIRVRDDELYDIIPA